jgi:hypothetical protein
MFSVSRSSSDRRLADRRSNKRTDMKCGNDDAEEPVDTWSDAVSRAGQRFAHRRPPCVCWQSLGSSFEAFGDIYEVDGVLPSTPSSVSLLLQFT